MAGTSNFASRCRVFRLFSVPFFYTQHARDIVTFNGVNYLGVGGEIVRARGV